MDTADIIILLLRIALPLSILRFPISGGFFAFALDLWDGNILDWLGGGSFFFQHYHTIDKLLDLHYLVLELLVSLRWKSVLLKKTSIILFTWRLAGTLLFFATGLRYLFIIFLNLFENFFLFCVIAYKHFPYLIPKTKKELLVTLLILLAPKLLQEYLLHVKYIGFKWIWYNLIKSSP